MARPKMVKKCGTSASYFAGCRCDRCRAAAASYNRERVAKRRAAGTPIRRTVAATCVGCGAVFQARSDMLSAGKGRFCTSDCHNAYQTTTGARAREREYVRLNGARGSVRRRALTRARAAAAGSSGGGRVFVQGGCLVCAEQFMSPGAASRYCSVKCRDKNVRKSFGLSWLDRMALFDRDGWTCQICSESVDYTADYLSDWYPSVDHIVPRAHGGSDDISNLRTAHRWCNSVRGDLSYYSDADLAA